MLHYRLRCLCAHLKLAEWKDETEEGLWGCAHPQVGPRAGGFGARAAHLPVGRGIHTARGACPAPECPHKPACTWVLLFVQYTAVLLLTSSYSDIVSLSTFVAFRGHLRGGGSTETPLYSKQKFFKMSGLYFWKQNYTVLIRGCGCSCQMEKSPCPCCCPGRRLWAEALPRAVLSRLLHCVWGNAEWHWWETQHQETLGGALRGAAGKRLVLSRMKQRPSS